MYLNLYQKHFSLITDINQYGKKFRCLECTRIFNEKRNFKRHVKTCVSGVTEVFPGGKFDANLDTVFDKLQKIGISVPISDRFYEFFSVYDFESIQCIDERVSHGRNIIYMHVPATFSVCANIHGFETPVHVQSHMFRL